MNGLLLLAVPRAQYITVRMLLLFFPARSHPRKVSQRLLGIVMLLFHKVIRCDSSLDQSTVGLISTTIT